MNTPAGDKIKAFVDIALSIWTRVVGPPDAKAAMALGLIVGEIAPEPPEQVFQPKPKTIDPNANPFDALDRYRFAAALLVLGSQRATRALAWAHDKDGSRVPDRDVVRKFNNEFGAVDTERSAPQPIARDLGLEPLVEARNSIADALRVIAGRRAQSPRNAEDDAGEIMQELSKAGFEIVTAGYAASWRERGDRLQDVCHAVSSDLCAVALSMQTRISVALGRLAAVSWKASLPAAEAMRVKPAIDEPTSSEAAEQEMYPFFTYAHIERAVRILRSVAATIIGGSSPYVYDAANMLDALGREKFPYSAKRAGESGHESKTGEQPLATINAGGIHAIVQEAKVSALRELARAVHRLMPEIARTLTNRFRELNISSGRAEAVTERERQGLARFVQALNSPPPLPRGVVATESSA